MKPRIYTICRKKGDTKYFADLVGIDINKMRKRILDWRNGKKTQKQVLEKESGAYGSVEYKALSDKLPPPSVLFSIPGPGKFESSKNESKNCNNSNFKVFGTKY